MLDANDMDEEPTLYHKVDTAEDKLESRPGYGYEIIAFSLHILCLIILVLAINCIQIFITLQDYTTEKHKYASPDINKWNTAVARLETRPMVGTCKDCHFADRIC